MLWEIKIVRGISASGSGWSSVVIKNYFEGTDNGSGGANSFTLGTPVTLLLFDNGDDVINH